MTQRIRKAECYLKQRQPSHLEGREWILRPGRKARRRSRSSDWNTDELFLNYFYFLNYFNYCSVVASCNFLDSEQRTEYFEVSNYRRKFFIAPRALLPIRDTTRVGLFRNWRGGGRERWQCVVKSPRHRRVRPRRRLGACA